MKPIRILCLKDSTVIGSFLNLTVVLNCDGNYLTKIFFNNTQGSNVWVKKTGSDGLTFQTPYCTSDFEPQIKFLSNFRNLHLDNPYLVRNFLSNSQCQSLFKIAGTARLQSVHWPMNFSNDHYYFDNSSNTLEIRSIESMCSLKVDINRRYFQVKYPVLLPKANSTYTENNKESEYVWHQQIFSINYFPDRWEAPLILCIYHILTSIHHMSHNATIEEIEKTVSNNQFKELDIAIIKSDMPIEVEQFISKLPSCQVIGSQCVTNLPSNSFFNAKFQTPNILSISDLLLVQKETTFPSLHILFEWTREAKYLYLSKNNQLEIQLFIDDSILMSKYDLKFFEHYMTNKTRLYCTDALPSTIQVNDNNLKSYTINSIVEHGLKLANHQVQLHSYQQNTTPYLPIQSNKTIIEELFIPKIAKCIAYNDGEVRVNFADRTMVTYQKDTDYITIMSKFGEQFTQSIHKNNEYNDYVNIVLDFCNWSFTDVSQRNEIEESKQQMWNIVNETLIQSELLLQNHQILFNTLKC